MPTINRACSSYDYDPRWGNAIHQYDERGRITENSVIGTYEYTRNGYQQQKLTTNEAGEIHLEKYPLPVIRYNAFKAPEQIYVKDKERISYEYNAFGERSHCYYGNAEVEKAKRPLLKHYSHDGSAEVLCNKTDNSTKFILYLGGDAYSAPAILISDGEAQKLYYLHRDYLGSIVMLTDEDGNIAERRHFDPWGQPIKVEDGAGNTLDKLTLLDRGYTGHEHLASVGLIHMNGRLYDPALHRFLQPDNYIQDPFNTQNFNRYGYCLNNPLVYVDENGEFLWAAVIIGAIFGAYTGGTLANNGEANPLKWNFSDNWGYIIGGTIVGAISGYIGGYLAGLQIPMANTIGIAGGSLVNSVGTWAYTEGKTEISISFGAASFNFNRGSFGYLFKKGNSTLENIGYGFGALANITDVVSLFGGGENVSVNSASTKDDDWWGHSSITDKDGNSLVSVGPDSPVGKGAGLTQTWKNSIKGADTNWSTYFGEEGTWQVSLNNISKNAISNYASKITRWDLLFNSCVGHTSRALWSAGVPNIYLFHPHMLNLQLSVYKMGILASPYIYTTPNKIKR